MEILLYILIVGCFSVNRFFGKESKNICVSAEYGDFQEEGKSLIVNFKLKLKPRLSLVFSN